mmetsp:Transcript_10077/g.20370  ORF Transcript_10077/g.20370 Transcript_10077/m.20370 type:complete len:209 (+) Transcript_10077:730-1356(+)
MTRLYSRSQHLTILSSPAEKRYGDRGLTASPRMVEMCPVSVSLSTPDARSHTLMVRSAEPVTNHSLVGSTAIARTHPRCPETTRISFHGACHSGFGTSRPTVLRRMPSVRPALGATGAVAGWPLTRLVLPPAPPPPPPPLPLLSVSIRPCDGPPPAALPLAAATLVTPPPLDAPAAEGGGRSFTMRYSACVFAIILSRRGSSNSARCP